MSKTAEQAWRNYCKKWVDCNPEGASLMAISDYKQALRRAIENHMGKISGDIENPYVNGRTLSLKKCLQFLDTVTPTKE